MGSSGAAEVDGAAGECGDTGLTGRTGTGIEGDCSIAAPAPPSRAPQSIAWPNSELEARSALALELGTAFVV